MIAKLKSAKRIYDAAGWPGLVAAGARRLGLRRGPLSMLTLAERVWTAAQVRDHYTGAGEIVDLGCWLGSSTIALARGLTANPHRAGRLVHAYDRFIWEAWMDECIAGSRLEGRFRPGDSFLAEFERQTYRWRGVIQPHIGDLRELDWSGAPIEFLFVDVMKSWELAGRVLQQFFPCLLPGAVVQHQDFVHYYTSWLPLLAYRLRDYLTPVCHIPGSPSMVFRVARTIPATAIASRYRFESFSADEFEAAFQWAEELIEPAMRSEIRLARIMAFIHAGQTIRAGMELMEQKDEGRITDTWGLRRVEEALNRQ